MEENIFKQKPCGWIGKQRASREWLQKAEERAKRVEAACKEQPVKDKRQMKLPGGEMMEFYVKFIMFLLILSEVCRLGLLAINQYPRTVSRGVECWSLLFNVALIMWAAVLVWGVK